MRCVVLLVFFAASVFGQAQLSLFTPLWCPSIPGAAVLIAYAAPQGVVSPQPLCLTLGPGLTIDPVAKTINVAPQAQAGSVLHMEQVTIDPATPAATTSINYLLTHAPAPGTPILIFFRSSEFGLNVSFAVQPAASNPQQLVVTLPGYRPFTAADQLSVVYSY